MTTLLVFTTAIWFRMNSGSSWSSWTAELSLTSCREPGKQVYGTGFTSCIQLSPYNLDAFGAEGSVHINKVSLIQIYIGKENVSISEKSPHVMYLRRAPLYTTRSVVLWVLLGICLILSIY